MRYGQLLRPALPAGTRVVMEWEHHTFGGKFLRAVQLHSLSVEEAQFRKVRSSRACARAVPRVCGDPHPLHAQNASGVSFLKRTYPKPKLFANGQQDEGRRWDLDLAPSNDPVTGKCVGFRYPGDTGGAWNADPAAMAAGRGGTLIVGPNDPRTGYVLASRGTLVCAIDPAAIAAIHDSHDKRLFDGLDFNERGKGATFVLNLANCWPRPD